MDHQPQLYWIFRQYLLLSKMCLLLRHFRVFIFIFLYRLIEA